MLNSLTDSELVLLINKEDRAAFNTVYRRYWRPLYISAHHILQDPDSSMDIVQEIFIWLWEHRGGLDISSLKGYLHSAVKYKVINYIRNGKVRESFFNQLEIAEPVSSVEEAFEVKELKVIIKEFTANLPQRSREIFTLSRIEYLSNKKIANYLGISEKTVENQMTITLKKLRQSLSKISL